MRPKSIFFATALSLTSLAAQADDRYATANPDNLVGTAGADNFVVQKRIWIPGDTYDGGGGNDSLWVTLTMDPIIDFPAVDFDFSTATIRNMETLCFNYMLMEMPGNVIFSSAQFGAGLLPNNLAIYGAWGDQDIAVNLVAGNSNFNASAWNFKSDLAAGAVWGPYVYPGLGEVGGVDTVHLNGSAGNNVIVGTVKDDIISGGAGNDTMQGHAGADVINGGPGVDTASYSLASGPVTVNLALTTPQNTVSAGVDTLIGVENLVGSAQGDTLTGNNGANIIEGWLGNDTINGGLGTDTASYQSSPAAVSVDLMIVGPQNTVGAGTDTLVSIENLIGSPGGDLLRGNAMANVIEGGPGNDTINGEAGLDTASYERAPVGVSVNLAVVGFQNTIGAGSDNLIAMENLRGSRFNDTLVGNAAANILEGDLGDDWLNGAGGPDTASYENAPAGVTVNLSIAAQQNTVGAGLDRLISIENVWGSAFSDTLTGNAGVNQIRGGGGKDTLTGAGGVDTFFYAAVGDSPAGAGRDTITDFVSGVDRIHLSSIDANITAPGDQPFAFIGAAAFGNVPGQLRFAGGVLAGDVDGNGAADFEIALPTVAALNPLTDIVP